MFYLMPDTLDPRGEDTVFEAGEEYCFELRQGADRLRRCEFVHVDMPLHRTAVARTRPIPVDVLNDCSADLHPHLVLEDGDPVGFDDSGAWLTATEDRAIDALEPIWWSYRPPRLLSIAELEAPVDLDSDEARSWEDRIPWISTVPPLLSLTTVDMRSASYDEFTEFLFRGFWRGWRPRDARDVFSYNGSDCEIIAPEPARSVEFYIQLFTEADRLPTRFTDSEIDMALWNANYFEDATVGRLARFDGVPLADRERLVRSVFDLYDRLFAYRSIGRIDYMFTDLICDELREADEDVRAVAHETFVRILGIEDSFDCQLAALHGLNHLQHPGTEAAIEDYVARQRLPKSAVEFARKCARGECQ